MPHMIIIRGLPGSGKSTLANELGLLKIEADMFFNKFIKSRTTTSYEYNPKMIYDAHDWCLQMAIIAMQTGVDFVVANTFTQEWEIKNYLYESSKYGYEVTILRTVGEFTNIHTVPRVVLENMKNKFEKIDGEIIVYPRNVN